MNGNSRPPSGTITRRRVTTSCAASRSIGSPSKRIVPAVHGSSPEIVLSSVVLPAPFAPTTETISSAPTREADVAQHRHVAVAGADALHLEERAHAGTACFLPR